jgi:hypothetical protein
MKKRNNGMAKLVTVLGMLILSILMFSNQKAYAAETSVTIKSVLYSNETLNVVNGSNTKIYYATEIEASKSNWEIINIDPLPATETEIDLSWLSPSIENVLMVKGDVDKAPKRLVIKGRPKKLEISINYENINNPIATSTIAGLLNIMSSEGTGNDPINYDDLQWKKGTGGDWQSSSVLTFAKFEKYLIKGTYLYFRIKAEDDITADPDGTKGRRYSSDVLVKVAKKTAPMVVGIDGEKFTAVIKYGKEYRVTAINGITITSPDWIKITDRTIKLLPLSKVLNQTVTISGVTSLIDGTIKEKAFPSMKFQIRNYSTSKAAASKITEISLKPQRTLDGTIKVEPVPTPLDAADFYNIYVGYNGTKYMSITIPSASVTLPYEYCIMKPGVDLEIDHVAWSSITKATETKVLSAKAVDGGILYVRQKEIKSKLATKTSSAVAYELASTYVVSPIKYPSTPVAEKQSIIFTKGYSGSVIIKIKLNETGRKPFETDIKNIKLGTKEIGILNPTTTVTDGNGVSTLTVTLLDTSLKSMTNCYNRAITINYMNGTVDKTSIKLTIQNPIPAATLTATPSKSAVAGTKITLVNTAGAGNTFFYTIDDAAVTGKNTIDKLPTTPTPNAFTGADITGVAAGKYITIYEVTDDANKYIMKYKSILITADEIK